MTITVKMTRPATSGAAGYRGQDDASRAFLRRFGGECIDDSELAGLARSAAWNAYTLVILPERDTVPTLPECTEF